MLALRQQLRLQSRRTFSTTRQTLSTVDEENAKRNPSKIDHERKRQDFADNKNPAGEDVSPHEHAPGWNPTLASESEETTKADRDPSATPENLKKMSHKTAEKVNKDHGN